MRLLYFTLLLISLLSCSNNDKEQLDLFDFGVGKYNEPFIGILESKPHLLVKSLEYLPFKWFVLLQKKIEITVNDECLRSNSTVNLQFVDSLGKEPQYTVFSINDRELNNNGYYIIADKESRQIFVHIKINPEVRAQALKGYVLANGKELDQVNDINLSSTQTIIGEWKCEQEIGYPFVLWLLWLLPLLILIALLVCVIKVIYALFTNLWVENIKRTYAKYNKRGEKEKKDDDDVIYEPFKVPSIKGKTLWLNEKVPIKPYQRKEFFIHGNKVWGIFPLFENSIRVVLPKTVEEYYMELITDSRFYNGTMRFATIELRRMIERNPRLKSQFTEKQLKDIEKGRKHIDGKIWHHYEELEYDPFDKKHGYPIMLLVDEKQHQYYKHTGGSYVWNEKKFILKYGTEWFFAKNRNGMRKVKSKKIKTT